MKKFNFEKVSQEEIANESAVTATLFLIEAYWNQPQIQPFNILLVTLTQTDQNQILNNQDQINIYNSDQKETAIGQQNAFAETVNQTLDRVDWIISSRNSIQKQIIKQDNNKSQLSLVSPQYKVQPITKSFNDTKDQQNEDQINVQKRNQQIHFMKAQTNDIAELFIQIQNSNKIFNILFNPLILQEIELNFDGVEPSQFQEIQQNDNLFMECYLIFPSEQHKSINIISQINKDPTNTTELSTFIDHLPPSFIQTSEFNIPTLISHQISDDKTQDSSQHIQNLALNEHNNQITSISSASCDLFDSNFSYYPMRKCGSIWSNCINDEDESESECKIYIVGNSNSQLCTIYVNINNQKMLPSIEYISECPLNLGNDFITQSIVPKQCGGEITQIIVQAKQRIKININSFRDGITKIGIYDFKTLTCLRILTNDVVMVMPLQFSLQSRVNGDDDLLIVRQIGLADESQSINENNRDEQQNYFKNNNIEKKIDDNWLNEDLPFDINQKEKMIHNEKDSNQQDELQLNPDLKTKNNQENKNNLQFSVIIEQNSMKMQKLHSEEGSFMLIAALRQRLQKQVEDYHKHLTGIFQKQRLFEAQMERLKSRTEIEIINSNEKRIKSKLANYIPLVPLICMSNTEIQQSDQIQQDEESQNSLIETNKISSVTNHDPLQLISASISTTHPGLAYSIKLHQQNDDTRIMTVILELGSKFLLQINQSQAQQMLKRSNDEFVYRQQGTVIPLNINSQHQHQNSSRSFLISLHEEPQYSSFCAFIEHIRANFLRDLIKFQSSTEQQQFSPIYDKNPKVFDNFFTQNTYYNQKLGLNLQCTIRINFSYFNNEQSNNSYQKVFGENNFLSNPFQLNLASLFSNQPISLQTGFDYHLASCLVAEKWGEIVYERFNMNKIQFTNDDLNIDSFFIKYIPLFSSLFGRKPFILPPKQVEENEDKTLDFVQVWQFPLIPIEIHVSKIIYEDQIGLFQKLGRIQILSSSLQLATICFEIISLLFSELCSRSDSQMALLVPL